MMLQHASLFSGIGGFDLAAEWAGWTNVFHCEINPFGQKILKHYWPKAISYGDITKTDFTIHRGTIDVLTGGFPCQPYSLAGKRKGKEDERHLWPEMLRAIREIYPTYIVGENVYGLVNWNGGLVFHEVQTDLEAEGYEILPVILPACGVNAPHRRERVWFIAHAKRKRFQKPEKSKQFVKLPDVERNNTQNDAPNPRLFRQTKRQEQPMGTEQLREEWDAPNPDLPGCERPDEQKPFGWSCITPESSFDGENGTASDANCEREPKFNDAGKSKEQRRIDRQFLSSENWRNFPTQPPVCSGNDGISGKLDGITFPKWRNESIKAYGNAIVPQVAFQIFKSINQCNETIK